MLPAQSASLRSPTTGEGDSAGAPDRPFKGPRSRNGPRSTPWIRMPIARWAEPYRSVALDQRRRRDERSRASRMTAEWGDGSGLVAGHVPVLRRPILLSDVTYRGT